VCLITCLAQHSPGTGTIFLNKKISPIGKAFFFNSSNNIAVPEASSMVSYI
jgi:hypothetical protein